MRSTAIRAGAALAAIIGASLIAFVFLRLLPGDPARQIAGPLAPESAVASIREDIGLSDSIPTQYWTFITNFARGDWGFSYGAGQDVRTQIGDRLPASLELAAFAFLLAVVGAVVVALLVTYRPRPALDRAVRGVSTIGLGTPPFWFGILLLLVFFRWIPILPGPGRLDPEYVTPDKVTGFYTVDALLGGTIDTFFNALSHLILPAIALALYPFAYLVRLLRANLLDVSREPFLVVVRSKGVSRWTAFRRHALPNAALPSLTAGALLMGELIVGAALIERVFNWNGIGQLVVDSIVRQDFAVVQTFILLAACAYVLVNLLVDVLYGTIDPRVRGASGVKG